MPKVLLIHGPNLNLLGRREPETYGEETLEEIDRRLQERATRLGLELETRQSNHEGILIDWIQEALEGIDALIINPGGYSHTSVALRDALAALSVPVLEVHLSNIHAREVFRRHSLVSEVSACVIAGAGAHGYELALEAAARLVRRD